MKKEKPDMRDIDRPLPEQSGAAPGSVWVFLLPLLAAVAWLLTGPGADLSNPWELVTDAAVNIGGLLVFFLVLFLIQELPGGRG